MGRRCKETKARGLSPFWCNSFSLAAVPQTQKQLSAGLHPGVVTNGKHRGCKTGLQGTCASHPQRGVTPCLVFSGPCRRHRGREGTVLHETADASVSELGEMPRDSEERGRGSRGSCQGRDGPQDVIWLLASLGQHGQHGCKGGAWFCSKQAGIPSDPPGDRSSYQFFPLIFI